MENNTRIAYIDIAKGIGILLVLLGHLLPNDSFVKSSIYAFHMPLFFIVMGGGKVSSRPFRQYAIKRGYQIMIPYFLWALIYGQLNIKSCALILYGTNESLLIAHSNGMLWFLTAMFAGSLLAYVVNSHSCSNNVRVFAIAVFVALAIALRYMRGQVCFFEEYGLPLGLDVVCLASAFILTGPIVIPTIHDLIKKHGNALICFLGIILLSVSCIGKVMKIQQGYPQMATLEVGYISLYFAVAVTSTIGILCLSEMFEKSRRITTFLSWLGQNSLLIFVMHRIVLYQFKGWYALHDNLLVLLVAFTCLTVFSSICAQIIRKIVPNLAGLTN